MSWFRWIRRKPGQEKEQPNVLERLDALERDNKRIRLEWEDTYETVLKALQKLGKREKRAAAAGCADCGPGEDPGAAEGHQNGAAVNWRDPQVKAQALARWRASQNAR